MPPNTKEAPVVPVELIQPIPGIADWCNQVLVALAASTYGDIKASVEVTGKSYDAFIGQQNRHPELKERVQQIVAIKDDHFYTRLKNGYKEGLVEGFKTVTIREREGYAPEITTTIKMEPRAMASALAAKFDEFNPHKQNDGDGPVRFSFDLGGNKELPPGNDEIEGEIVE